MSQSIVLRSGGRGGGGSLVLQKGNLSRRENKQKQMVVQVQAPRNRTKTTNKQRMTRGAGGSVTSIGSAYSRNTLGGRPVFSGAAEGGLCVSHRESIADVVGTSSFGATYYALLPENFAWLAGVARNFSRYRWELLEFTFVTSSPTSQYGQIAMGALYDSTDTLATSLREVAAMAHSFLSPVWSPMPGVVKYDCNNWNQKWYANQPFSTDLSTEKIPGWLAVATLTQVNGNSIGHLMVNYKIRFSDPIPAILQPAPENPSRAIKRTGQKNLKATPTFEENLCLLLEALATGNGGTRRHSTAAQTVSPTGEEVDS